MEDSDLEMQAPFYPEKQEKYQLARPNERHWRGLTFK